MQRLPIAIEDALVAWIGAIHADATPMWANQDGPRPRLPFIVLDVIAGPRSIGTAEERYTQEDTYTYGIRKRGTLAIQVFAVDALVRAGAIVNALELPSRQAILQAAGIAVWGSDGPRDITELMDTAHEPRASLDLFLSWPEPADDAPGEIRGVRVIGTMDSITVDRTIDIQEE
jgi:hypothetical protein